MTERNPTTETISADEVGRQWSELLDRIARRETRVIIEANGDPVAAVISPKDFAWLTRLEAEREADFAILDEMGEAFEDVADEEIEREVGQALAEVRRERRHRARIPASGVA